MAIDFDAGFWDFASAESGIVLKEKSFNHPRAAVFTWSAASSDVTLRASSQPDPSGAQLHNIQTGKTCGGGAILLNASYLSAQAPQFDRELKLLAGARCP